MTQVSPQGLRVRGLRQEIAGFTVDADFSVAAGERLALTGPSGSGKTTLVRILAGLLPLAGSGSVELAGRDITGLRPEQRRIGVVFQEQALFGAMDVLANVTFGLRHHGVSAREAEVEGREWLARVGLGERARSPVTVLSGGERQRVAFVRALIWKPDLVLLDEPFSALDRELKEQLRDQLRELHGLWPAPMLIVTHDEDDVRRATTGRIALQPESTPGRRVFRRQ